MLKDQLNVGAAEQPEQDQSGAGDHLWLQHHPSISFLPTGSKNE